MGINARKTGLDKCLSLRYSGLIMIRISEYLTNLRIYEFVDSHIC